MNSQPTGQTYKPQSSFFIGIAAVDKEKQSRKLKVYCRELQPFNEGNYEATEVKAQPKVAGDTTSGVDTEVTLKNFVECEYWDMASNRAWPPDIRKGEQVMVITMANTDLYYWMPMGRDDNYRRCERLRFAVSDTVDHVATQNDDNTWFMEMDTLDQKKFTIKTAKSDTETPEKFRYTFEIDAKNNTITICDDANNEIKLHSDSQRIFLRNGAKSMIDLNKDSIVIEAPSDIVLNYGRQLVQNGPVATGQNTEQGATNVMKSKNLTINCTDSFTINAPSIGLNGGDVSIPKTLTTGHHQAESISTGKPTEYKDATTDIRNGKATGGNTPKPASRNPDNKPVASWEGMDKAMTGITAEIKRINEKLGMEFDDTEIKNAVASAQMNTISGA